VGGFFHSVSKISLFELFVAETCFINLPEYDFQFQIRLV
jgi:hypothetical protein